MRLGFLIALSLVLTAPAARAQAKPGNAQVAFPTGDRGKLARQWLDAYNGGDVAAYRQFMEANAETGGTPVDARVERYGQMQQNLGKLTVLEAKETSEGIELKVRTAHDEAGTVTVIISAAAPFKFQAVKVEI